MDGVQILDKEIEKDCVSSLQTPVRMAGAICLRELTTVPGTQGLFSFLLSSQPPATTDCKYSHHKRGKKNTVTMGGLDVLIGFLASCLCQNTTVYTANTYNIYLPTTSQEVGAERQVELPPYTLKRVRRQGMERGRTSEKDNP